MPHKLQPDQDISVACLERFMRRRDLNAPQAAELLGVKERSIYWYLSKKYPMSKTMVLLIKALEENLKLKSQ
jgi:plasmid maintenance system antidote protein VapI